MSTRKWYWNGHVQWMARTVMTLSVVGSGSKPLAEWCVCCALALPKGVGRTLIGVGGSAVSRQVPAAECPVECVSPEADVCGGIQRVARAVVRHMRLRDARVIAAQLTARCGGS